MIADREYEILTSLVDYANNNCEYFTNKIILVAPSHITCWASLAIFMVDTGTTTRRALCIMRPIRTS